MTMPPPSLIDFHGRFGTNVQSSPVSSACRRSENIIDPLLLAVPVEGGFSSPHAPEYAAMIRKGLSEFPELMNCII